MRICFWGAIALLALCTVHSKIAGLLWGGAFLFAAWMRYRRGPSLKPIDSVTGAAKLWLVILIVVLGLWLISAALFGELLKPQSAEPNAGLRLLIGALAVAWLVNNARAECPDRMSSAINAALTAGCAIAVVIAVTEDRASYPSNAIVWSAGLAFWMVILSGEMLRTSLSRQTFLVGVVGVLVAIAAILLSRTRGVYPALLWPLVLVALAGAQSLRQTAGRRILLVSGMAACTAIAASVLSGSDPLRLREAASDIQEVKQESDFNSSTGVRVYLLRLGWEAFTESPLIGVGAAERKRRIQSAGIGEGTEVEQATQSARKLGHVHNAYLHHAMDGGIISLAGFLLTIGGLVYVGWTLRREHPTSAWQLYGIAFVHAVTNLSSVNFAHNYYPLMLAISVGVVLIQARLNLLVLQQR
ncbi:MAG: O-antigen ligase family protein [Betaproteobacteria bacterium]|nr:O-antigen ligase family protein [Betaproteobacteria bacterium]